MYNYALRSKIFKKEILLLLPIMMLFYYELTGTGIVIFVTN